MIKVPDGTLRILVQGVQRVRLVEAGRGRALPRRRARGPAGDRAGLARGRSAHAHGAAAVRADHRDDAVPARGAPARRGEHRRPTALTHLIASTLRLKTEERQELLETVDVEERLRRIASILGRELEMSELGSKIQSQVASEIDKGQREFFLRQQLKAIQEELGETDDHQAEINELVEQLEAKNLPEHVAKAAEREVRRLERLPPAAAEYGVIRTYLDWILSLWRTVTEDNLDLDHAQEILDEDHFDLEKVKERIVEYLAVSKLKNDLSEPDPLLRRPARRRQDLARPVDRARARPHVRPDLGRRRPRRVRDPRPPAHLHRRDARHDRARDPRRRVVEPRLPDRRDRQDGRRLPRRPCLGDARGARPRAALELPRPLPRLPYDLSKVLFICTANTLDTIPGPLLDRMDVIQLSGYTHEEKLGIAKRYLVPKQIAAHGLRKSKVAIPDKTLRLVIAEYTREAGVRNLDRQIATLCRKAATLVANGHTEKIRIDEERVRDWLGARKFSADARKRTADPGVATGLAYTPSAATSSSSRRPPIRQGPADDHGPARRGDAGVGADGAPWVRSHADGLGLDADWFAEHDVHVHVRPAPCRRTGPPPA